MAMALVLLWMCRSVYAFQLPVHWLVSISCKVTNHGDVMVTCLRSQSNADLSEVAYFWTDLNRPQVMHYSGVQVEFLVMRQQLSSFSAAQLWFLQQLAMFLGQRSLISGITKVCNISATCS